MTFRTTLVVVLAVIATGSVALVGQTLSQQPQIIKSEDASRDRSNDEPYDIPELFGSRPFKPGELEGLAPLLVEYSARAGNIFERISIFQNGVVSVHVNSEGVDSRKTLIISDEALATYREQAARVPLDQLAVTQSDPAIRSRASLRIVRDDRVQERRFATTDVLPQDIENFRSLLVDLLRAIADDRQVTNPLTGYVPKVGDRLISEDRHMYEIKRFVNDGTIVEVELVGKFTRMYVPTEMIYKMFIDLRPGRAQ